MLSKILRLYYTVKYLKLKQIIWRVFSFFPRLVIQVSNYPDEAKSNFEIKFIARSGFTNDFKKFTFLNETHDLTEIGWDNALVSKLWRYNLHYFDFLLDNNESSTQIHQKTFLIENWINSNTFGKGTGWESYPTSVRIINWIKWNSVTGSLSERAKLSLWNQVRWLAARPEYHLLGNHLFINAKALLFASAFFQQNEYSKIYRKGFLILKSELDEQFLADGAHFELSPMYHSLAMEDLLDLVCISTKLPLSFSALGIKEKYFLGMKWLQSMIYKGNELAHFNDCANGIAPTFKDLENYGNRLNLHVKQNDEQICYHYVQSGFIVFKEALTHLIADIGKVGPDYLPGHSHADTLSFELSIKGERVIVNSGTSVYGNSQERLRQRGTIAHTTVQIDGYDSSEVWSGFRVARRAKPLNININYNYLLKNSIKFNASHDGYERLKNKPKHTRFWSFEEKVWNIEDEITGYKNLITARYYLHPDIVINKSNQGFVIKKDNMHLAEILFTNVDCIEIFDTTYHDQFGVSKPNKCITVSAKSPCRFGINIKVL